MGRCSIVMKPLVSVIMPVHNAENYIKESIDSILEQTYDNFELVIIDDCGTDHSMEIVTRYQDPRIKVLCNKINRGIAYSRNRGLNICKGKYIAILDDDDISTVDRLEKQVNFLECHDIDVLGGEAVWINERGKIIRDKIPMPTEPDYIKTSFLFENIFNNSEVMFKRNLIEEYGIRYQDGLLGMEDFKFWIDCSKVGRFSNLPELLLKRRMVNENTTNQIMNTKKEERKKVFQDLQKYSLFRSGFKLTEDELKILYKCLGEGRMEKMLQLKEFSFLLSVFDKMVMQCRELNFVCDIQFESYLKERLKNCL